MDARARWGILVNTGNASVPVGAILGAIMFRKRSELAFCYECNDNVEIVFPEPALDHRGRRHINWDGQPATQGLCAACGATSDDILYPPWNWKFIAVALTWLFGLLMSSGGLYLFGYWSWKDHGGISGWPTGSYLLSLLFGVCDVIALLGLLACIYAVVRYLRVRRRFTSVGHVISS